MFSRYIKKIGFFALSSIITLHYQTLQFRKKTTIAITIGINKNIPPAGSYTTIIETKYKTADV